MKKKLFLAAGTTAGVLAACMLVTPMACVLAVGSNPATTDLDITLEPVMSISVDDDEVALELNPSANSVTTASTGVLVSTNANEGYTLYITTDSAETALKHRVATVSTQIPTLTEAKTAAEFPTNAWGYYDEENSQYAGVPASGAQTAVVHSTTGPAWYDESDGSQADEIAAAKFDLTIGARADSSVVSGNYSNTVVLTAVANS